MAAARLAAVPNHPRRSKANDLEYPRPSPAEIRKAREKFGLTQAQAAAKIRVSARAWQNYESDVGLPNHRPMLPGLWELFLIKLGQPSPFKDD